MRAIAIRWVLDVARPGYILSTMKPEVAAWPGDVWDFEHQSCC